MVAQTLCEMIGIPLTLAEWQRVHATTRGLRDTPRRRCLQGVRARMHPLFASSEPES